MTCQSINSETKTISKLNTYETNKESNKEHQKIYLYFLIKDPRNPTFTTNLQ